METFQIFDILGSEHRRPSWVIAEHADRRVLRLSKYMGRVTYSAFAASKGYKLVDGCRYPIVRGTVRTKWSKELEVEVQGEIKVEPKEKEEVKEKMEDELQVQSNGTYSIQVVQYHLFD